MAKLGLPKHRYAVAIICWLYVVRFLSKLIYNKNIIHTNDMIFLQVLSILLLLYNIFVSFSATIFVMSLINLAISCFGLYSLRSENDTLMKSVSAQLNIYVSEW